MNGKEKENFCRTSIVIVDHGKDALVWLLQYDLERNKLTFEDFINLHRHAIYHLCYTKGRCCQCKGPAKFGSRVLFPTQLDILFDNTKKVNCNNVGNTLCCHPAKQGLTFEKLDVTLLRCLLVNVAAICKSGSVQADIETLRSCRNKLHAHAVKAEIDNDDYQIYKEDITKALMNIARTCGKANDMEGNLNQVYKLPFTEALRDSYQITLLDEIRIKTNAMMKEQENRNHVEYVQNVEQAKRKLDTLDNKFEEMNKRIVSNGEKVSDAIVTGGKYVAVGIFAAGVCRLIGKFIPTSEEKQTSK